jgi:hypothetical protein
MRSRNPLGCAVLVAVFLAGCGTTTAPSDAPDEAAVGSASPSGPGPEGGVAKAPSGKPGSKDGKKGAGGPGGSGGSGSPGGDGDGSASSGDGSGGTGPDGGSGDGGSSPASSPARSGGARSPASGTYVYAQRGFEEFCSPTCERDRLPRRQRIDASIGSRTSSSTVVVTKARASGDRLVRTTTRYTDATARVLEVHLEYSYEGFTFSRTYRPEPPVTSLRFPLAPGDSWSGRWSGDVSGSYSVAVEGRETSGGRRVVQLGTKTRFRGDLKGHANVTLWVDPRDGTVMRTAGNMTADMGFGTYRTGFATSLSSAP